MRSAIFSILLWSSIAIGAGKMPEHDPCSVNALLEKLFSLRPNQIKWNIDLRDACTISDQGGIGSCVWNAATEMYTHWFQRGGEITSKQRVSADYYAAIQLRNRYREAFKHPGPIVKDEGAAVYLVEKHFYTYGIVLEDQFKFPLVRGEGTIRNNRETNEAFYQLLNQAKERNNENLFNEILDIYVGKVQNVKPRRVSENFKKLYSGKSYYEFMLPAAPISQIEKEIVHALNQKVPVTFSMREQKEGFTLAGKYSFFFDHLEGKDPNHHAMNIIGYHLNPQGEVDYYLIQNSYGFNFGSQGTATIPAETLYKKTSAYHIPMAQ